jgi:hypothetical protein
MELWQIVSKRSKGSWPVIEIEVAGFSEPNPFSINNFIR